MVTMTHAGGTSYAESELNLEALIELFPDIVLLVNFNDGRILGFNSSAPEAYGYSREELLRLAVVDLRAPDSHESLAAQLQAANSAGARFQTTHRRKDATLFPVEVSSRGATFNGTRVLVSVIRDISNRLRVEAELRESELRFRSAFDQAVVGVAHVGLDGRWLRVNQRLCDILGYTEAELLRLDFQSVVHPDDAKADIEALRRHAAGESREYVREKRCRRKDGSVIWVLITAALVRSNSGEPQYFSTIVEDVTRRKMTDDQLQLIKVSIDRAPHAAYWFDPDGRIIYVNEAGCRCLGYSREEMLGMSVEDVNPNATRAKWQEVFQANKLGQPIAMESVHRRKDGSLLNVEVTSSHFQLEGREYCLVFSVDISERLRAQREHSALQAQLNHAQKMESVGRLAGGVAHDFNNMLTIIQMSTQQALEQLEPNHPIREDLLDIDNATKRSADLTGQLLAFARKQPIAPEALDLNATVQGMLTMLRRLLGENLELKWHPASDLWQVLMDPSQLDQLLANLCVNSRDAIGDVGTVSIATVNRTFDEDYLAKVPGTLPGDYVELRVTDNGCGMDAETQAHLFEPFFTTKGEGKGTGLGLATVYGIVKQNGGFIVLRSERGQGTTIAVCLPRHVGTFAEVKTQATWSRLRSGGQTVLVVEDESTILRLIARTLAKLGYNVLPAPTPVRAVDIAREHAGSIHLLLTDVVMPQMNGRELAQRIRAICPQVKCLFMSGYTSDVVAHHGVHDAGLSFISKPFTAKMLAAKVREALDGLPS